MAETEGFEPSVRVNPVRRFSKPLVSATHPRLREGQSAGYSGAALGNQPAVCAVSSVAAIMAAIRSLRGKAFAR
jgi:hypothetical protein